MERALGVLASMLLAVPSVVGQQYTRVDYPSAKITRLRAINNAGDIAGSWLDDAGRNHGLLWRAGSQQMESFDCDGAVSTLVVGINANREMVGTYQDAANAWHAFYMGEPGGQCYIIDPPGAVGKNTDTTASGISDEGEIAGQFVDENGVYRGFLMRGPVHMIFEVVPGYSGAWSITPNGDLLGHIAPAGDRMKGWLLSRSKLTVYEFPPAEENAMTCGFGGNSKGEVVGHYQRRGAAIHGFLLSRGEFLQLDYPDSIRTDAYGINDAGVIVGISTDKEQRVHGFILRR